MERQPPRLDVYWRDRNHRWRRYEYSSPTTEIATLLEEIDRDPTGDLPGLTTAAPAPDQSVDRWQLDGRLPPRRWEPQAGRFADVASRYPFDCPRADPCAGVPIQVVWLQEFLANQIPAVQTDGMFAPQTLANLRLFQTRHRIPPTGQTGTLTWQRCCVAPARSEGEMGGRRRALARATGRTAAASTQSRTAAAPESAALHALRYEIHGPTGADSSG
jgi:hypothetical protein